MRKTYRYDRRRDAMVEVRRSEPGSHQVMGDCWSSNPTVSVVDGTMIDSRAALRRHNERNEVECVGMDGAFTYERMAEAQRKRREALPVITGREIAECYDRLEANPGLAREIEDRDRRACTTDGSRLRYMRGS